MRRTTIAMGCVAAAGCAALIYRELPALRRYLRIRRM